MPLKILHTSDVHLGMKFASYPDVQLKLSEARYETLGKLVKLANSERCELFVIAGDLFHLTSVAKGQIHKAAEILKEFNGKLIVILPGNHDFLTGDRADTWGILKDKAGDNFLLLEKKEVYDLRRYDLDVHMYPAPCDSKHSEINYIGWIKDVQKDNNVKYHIGIAHGSLEGFSPDFDKKYYPMSVQELRECGIDLWLMGHTHIHYPEKPGERDIIFYPSTPEPDGFDCVHEGGTWIIDIDDDKKIRPQLRTTGNYRFLHDEVTVNEASDLERLKTKYASGYSKTLLKLKLRGRLPKEEYNSLSDLKKYLESQLFYLQFDNEIAEKVTLDDINRTFTEGSFPHMLLTKLAENNEIEALQIAHDLLVEQKQ